MLVIDTSHPQPLGELEYSGKVHGASNYLLRWYDDPEDWEFKQFVSEDQLNAFAADNNLIIKRSTENE